MKPWGRLTFLALATTLLASASGCIVEHRFVRDARELPPAPPPPAPRESVGASDDVAPSDGGERAEAGPGVDVPEGYFNDRLSSYGHWIWTPEYGRVWVPDGVAADFRPYSDGHWVLSDWGWTYASDVPWGWAAYHYGRWGYGLGIGWYWLPGSIWAPAWVNWRCGGGYVAWSPLGPGGAYWGVNSPAWVVVGERHFTQPIRAVAISPHQARGIVAAATPQAHVAPQRIGTAGRVASGPPVARISQSIGRELRPVPIAKVLPQAGFGRAVGHAGSSYGGTQRYASTPRAGRSTGGGDSWNRSVRPGRPGASSGRSPGRWGGGSYPPRTGARSYGGGGRSYGGARSYGGGGRSYGGARSYGGGGGGARSYSGGGAQSSGGSHSSSGSHSSGGGHSSGGSHATAHH